MQPEDMSVKVDFTPYNNLFEEFDNEFFQSRPSFDEFDRMFQARRDSLDRMDRRNGSLRLNQGHRRQAARDLFSDRFFRNFSDNEEETMTPPRRQSPQPQQQHSPRQFEFKLDVEGYRPQDLDIRVEKNVLHVSGKYEHRSPSGFSSETRQFDRKVPLEEDIIVDQMKSSLCNNELIITAPYKVKRPLIGERVIPIQMEQKHQQHVTRTKEPEIKKIKTQTATEIPKAATMAQPVTKSASNERIIPIVREGVQQKAPEPQPPKKNVTFIDPKIQTPTVSTTTIEKVVDDDDDKPIVEDAMDEM